MAIKLTNKNQISTYLVNYANRIEKALIYSLEFLVAELINHAKQNGNYKDQTANLRSSIGGVVLKNGNPISYKGFSGKGEGTSSGLEFINSLTGRFGSGYTILIVAGMEYATYVEDINDLNVLKKTELEMNKELPKMIDRLKLRLDK